MRTFLRELNFVGKMMRDQKIRKISFKIFVEKFCCQGLMDHFPSFYRMQGSFPSFSKMQGSFSGFSKMQGSFTKFSMQGP